MFWFGETRHHAFENGGSTTLDFYLCDELIGTSQVEDFSTSTPNCSDNGVISVTRDLNGNKQHEFIYEVKDDLDQVVQIGTVTLEADNCLQFEL